MKLRAASAGFRECTQPSCSSFSTDLPIVIEIVDGEDKINAFLPELEMMMGSGLVTIERVQVRQYGLNNRTA